MKVKWYDWLNPIWLLFVFVYWLIIRPLENLGECVYEN